MRIPILSAYNDLLEARASNARVQTEINTLAETSWSRFVDEEEDQAEWRLISGENLAYKESWARTKEGEEYLAALRSRARWLVRFDGIAQSIMGAFRQFIWGPGPVVVPNDDNPQHRELWRRFCTQQQWTDFGGLAVYDLFRDGEIFIYDTLGTARHRADLPRFQLLPVENFHQPSKHLTDKSYSLGVQTNPRNLLDVRRYCYHNADNILQLIDSSRIRHIKINCDANDKRGRSCLEPVIQDVTDYRKFRINRSRLNWVRTLFGVVHVMKGSPAQVQAYSESMQKDGSQDSKNRKWGHEMRPGSQFFTNQDVKMLSPNLDAADAQYDGRMILLSIAAALGLSETWLTADAQNANYASQAVAESPAVRTMQMWQKFFSEKFVEWVYPRVIEHGLQRGEIDRSYEQKHVKDGEIVSQEMPAILTCRVEWPELIHRDFEKVAEASERLLGSGVSDPRTEAARVGLDYDTVLENRVRDVGTKQEEEGEKTTPKEKPSESKRVLNATNRLAASVSELVETLSGGNGKKK